MGGWTGAFGLAGTLLVLAACTTRPTSAAGGPAPVSPAPAATVDAGPSDPPADCPPSPVGRGPRVRDGDVDFEVLAVTAPIRAIVGTHAEFEPRGEYVRVRVAVDNPDSTFHDISTNDQRLLDTAGRRFEPSPDAMRIKRQPDDINLGSGNRLEFDLWFDVPDGDTPRTLLARAGGCGRQVLLPSARP